MWPRLLWCKFDRPQSARAADTDEEKALSRLWHAEVSGIGHLRQHVVLAIQGEVGRNLLAHTHLVHARHVLDHKRRRQSLLEDIEELTVERVPRVFD